VRLEGQAFIDASRHHLTSSLLPRIERCMEQLSDQELWWRPNDDSNSVGNLLLHLAGNVRQWIVSGVGNVPDVRKRQEEFDERGPIPRGDLAASLRAAVADADATLARLSPDSLLQPRRIQGFDVTVLEAIYHVVEHFSMHTGQIIFVTKMRKGDLAFYDLSGGTPRPRWTHQAEPGR
jgi:uncharacterized damage-inducible protein DinB